MANMMQFLFCILPIIVFSERIKNADKEELDCEGFESEECLHLLYEYYHLTEAELHSYGRMQQSMLADYIECHNNYDICPFYIPRIGGNDDKISCTDNNVPFIDENDETATYSCNNIDLLSFVPLEELGSNNNASGADIWGYQTIDPETGLVNGHYAVTSQADGASIVDITDPLNPNVLAFIESNVNKSSTNYNGSYILRNVLWRDVKVYKDFAIVVADTGGINDHGIQLFNITEVIEDAVLYQLEMNSTEAVYNVPYEDIILYEDVGRCHNVYVDDDIGHLYAFGSMGKNGNTCGTGIHIIDINDPYNPTFMGCYDGAGYVHDAQCVIYQGPDEEYQGNEICFLFTPDHGNLTIIDITNASDIVELSRVTYFTDQYNHQGWITDNHEYLLLDDEGDEGAVWFEQTVENQTTYIFDIRDLDKPIYSKAYHSGLNTVDHNQYILDNGKDYSCSSNNYRGYTFQANYEAGLRILNIDNIANEKGNEIHEVAYFDMYPWRYYPNGSNVHHELKFFGSWSVYPYFNELGTDPEDNDYSSTIIVQSTTTGLYVLSFDDISRIWKVDDGSSDDFEWNSWYGVLLGIVIALAVIALIGFIVFKLMRRSRKSSDFQQIMEVEAEETNRYGATAQ